MSKYASQALQPVVLGVQVLFPSFVPPTANLPAAFLVATTLACVYFGALGVKSGRMGLGAVVIGFVIWMLMGALGNLASGIALHLNAAANGATSPWHFDLRGLLWWQLPTAAVALTIVGFVSLALSRRSGGDSQVPV